MKDNNLKEKTINNTEIENSPEMSHEEKIINAINMIKPYINADGGDIEFIKYEDKCVFVRFHGACANCGSINYTIEDFLFNTIHDEVPEVEKVINVPL